MHAAEASKSNRKPTNLSLDSALLKEAKALGINISRSAEAGIVQSDPDGSCAPNDPRSIRWAT